MVEQYNVDGLDRLRCKDFGEQHEHVWEQHELSPSPKRPRMDIGGQQYDMGFSTPSIVQQQTPAGDALRLVQFDGFQDFIYQQLPFEGAQGQMYQQPPWGVQSEDSKGYTNSAQVEITKRENWLMLTRGGLAPKSRPVSYTKRTLLALTDGSEIQSPDASPNDSSDANNSVSPADSVAPNVTNYHFFDGGASYGLADAAVNHPLAVGDDMTQDPLLDADKDTITSVAHFLLNNTGSLSTGIKRKAADM